MEIMVYLKTAPKFFEAFKEGKEIGNAATWKNRTIATNAILALLGTLLAIAHNFGFKLELDNDTVQNLAAGAVALVTAINAVMHTVTTTRTGLPSKGGDSTPQEQPDDAGKPSEG